MYICSSWLPLHTEALVVDGSDLRKYVVIAEVWW